MPIHNSGRRQRIGTGVYFDGRFMRICLAEFPREGVPSAVLFCSIFPLVPLA